MVLLWSGTSSLFLKRLLLTFICGIIIRQAQANLETFKNLAEIHGIHFSKILKLVYANKHMSRLAYRIIKLLFHDYVQCFLAKAL